MSYGFVTISVITLLFVPYHECMSRFQCVGMVGARLNLSSFKTYDQELLSLFVKLLFSAKNIKIIYGFQRSLCVRVQLSVFSSAIALSESFGWQGLCFAFAAFIPPHPPTFRVLPFIDPYLFHSIQSTVIPEVQIKRKMGPKKVQSSVWSETGEAAIARRTCMVHPIKQSQFRRGDPKWSPRAGTWACPYVILMTRPPKTFGLRCKTKPIFWGLCECKYLKWNRLW